MIKFGKLRWKNLLSTGEVFTEVDLSLPGTTLIVGANGSGKSTMLEALSFALYGKSFRRVNKSQLVNSINKKGMTCEVEFEANGHSYLVRRGMKPNVFDVIMDGQSLDQHGAISDLQDHLERYVLRMNYRACMQVVVLGSASYVPFMELTAQHRREVLEDVLDIRVLGVMGQLLKSRMEATAERHSVASTRVSIAADRLRVARLAETAKREDTASLVARLTDRRAQVVAKLDDAASRGVSLAEKLKELTASLTDDETGEMDKIRDRLSAVRAAAVSTRDKRSFFDNNTECPICESPLTEEHKAAEISSLERELSELSAEESTLAARLSEVSARVYARNTATREITAIRAEIGTLRGIITAFQSEIDSVDSEIAKANSPSKTVDVIENVMALEDEMEDARRELESVESEREVQRSLSSMLRDDGVKAAIVRQYIPVLNQLVNKYLSALDFFVNFEFDESFNERILSRHRDDFSYNSFSEGEKTRINLAILFTWRAVARMRNSASTNVVIMDEVFDSSLDGAGAEDFTAMLSKMVGDTNVVIISHRTDQMTDKFDRVVRFSKTKNFSGIDT